MSSYKRTAECGGLMSAGDSGFAVVIAGGSSEEYFILLLLKLIETKLI